MNTQEPTITIVGLGLLGASAAAALRQNLPNWRVRGVSGKDARSQALAMELVHEAWDYEDFEQWVPGSHLILLCTPINSILNILQTLSEQGANLQNHHPIVVSDVGSTKTEICRKGNALPKPFVFVGGHPMAGSEKKGITHRDPSLFENAYWIVCPPNNLPDADWLGLRHLIEALGSTQVRLDPELHDYTLARLSHMPQLVSTALAGSIPQDLLQQKLQHLAGPGFRDMTRIAASSYSMWRDILLTNRQQVEQALIEFSQSISNIQTALQCLGPGDNAMGNAFAKGTEVRSSLSLPGKGFSHCLSELVVRIPDRQGQLLSVIEPITKAGLDIRDIELLKVREGIGGTLLLGMNTPNDAKRAMEILQQCGMQANLR